MFDLEQYGCQDVLWKSEQAGGMYNSAKLVGSQIVYLGMGEMKMLFDIIVTLKSFKSRIKTGQSYNKSTKLANSARDFKLSSTTITHLTK